MGRREQILTISKDLQLSHMGSCLSALPIIQEIYEKKKPQDIFILDAGHSHLAHLVVRKGMGEDIDVENLIVHDIHCNKEAGCEVSTGSLGLGLSIACGYALADRERDVYCVTSDGAMMEGITWEVLRLKADLQITNLKITVNANGFGGLGAIDTDKLEERIHAFCPDVEVRRTNSDFGDIKDLAAHYITFVK